MADKELRFLVVDDFSTMRNRLKELGFNNVEEAEDGADALVKLKAAPFDFVISDWNMHNMDELSLLQAIRAAGSMAAMPGVNGHHGSQKRKISSRRRRWAPVAMW